LHRIGKNCLWKRREFVIISHKLNAGDTVGERYRIVAPLGSGGMGTVYLAEDLRLIGKKWAVKVVLHDQGEEEQLAKEAEMLVSLQHPQLPHIVDYFPPDERGLAYVVMDYVQGPTLQNVFERSGMKLPDAEVIGYAIQLCGLLQYLHDYKPRPIVYRDLKPANIMVGENGDLRLIDFGIARHFKVGQQGDTLRIGTVGFAAPEQFAGEQSDCRSDLYALGALMYYLLTGGSMYYVSPVSLAERRPDLPASLAQTIGLLLAEHPDKRIQSATEARDRLLPFSTKKLWVGEEKSTMNSETTSLATMTHQQDRLIAVGGLYAGAGSTFVAMAIARLLHACGVPNAFVEHPLVEPDLYMLLYGDKRAPHGYKFAADVTLEGNADWGAGALLANAAWIDGHTTWVPANPDGTAGKWTIAHTYKLLYNVRRPVTIWDVSTAWEDESVAELCKTADAVLLVAESSPAKLNRPVSRKRMETWLGAGDRSGKSGHVEWIANRLAAGAKYPRDWLASMPKPPIARLHEASRDLVQVSEWKGTCLHDEPGVLDSLSLSLLPALQRLLPELKLQLPGGHDRRLWSRLRSHKRHG